MIWKLALYTVRRGVSRPRPDVCSRIVASPTPRPTSKRYTSTSVPVVRSPRISANGPDFTRVDPHELGLLSFPKSRKLFDDLLLLFESKELLLDLLLLVEPKELLDELLLLVEPKELLLDLPLLVEPKLLVDDFV